MNKKIAEIWKLKKFLYKCPNKAKTLSCIQEFERSLGVHITDLSYENAEKFVASCTKCMIQKIQKRET